MNGSMQVNITEWCGWFWRSLTHVCSCGRWEAGQPAGNGVACPVVAAGNPAFVPEPVRGNPIGREVVFLGANPGGGGVPSQQVELDTCPWWDVHNNQPGGGWDEVLGSVQAFADYHVHGNERAARDVNLLVGYAADMPTRSAVGIMLRLHGHENPGLHVNLTGDSCARSELANTALLNVAHCKCPQWPQDSNAAAFIGERCGRRTFDLLQSLKPSAVVCFGMHIWEVLARIVALRSRDENWRIDHEPANGAKWGEYPGYGEYTLIHWGDGSKTALVAAYHPSNFAYYTEPHVQAVVNKLREVLDGQQ